MSQEDLEKYLKRHTRRIYAVEITFAAVFLIAFIALRIAYLQSARVEMQGFFHNKEVTVYNEDLNFPMGMCCFAFVMAAYVLILTKLFSKKVSFELAGNFITIYSPGITSTKLYINGECKDCIILYGSYLESKTPDGILVTATFSGHKHIHVTFSNGHPPLDF